MMQKEGGLILDASSYILKSGGKRIRPILLVLTSMLCNYKGNADILFAQIIEMVHTATLIHDDIIDGSAERRGKPAAHIKFGNNLTVLLGDYFFSKAMDLAIEYGNQKILKTLSDTMVTMVSGEISGLLHKWDTALSEQALLEIIEKKTAHLFSICTQIPAILAELPSQKEQCLKQFGLSLGIAFQLIDDLLDYTSEDSIMGKPSGNDLKEGKITLPLLYALQNAPDNEISEILAHIKNGAYAEINQQVLFTIMKNYNAFEYTKNMARYFADRAMSSLASFNNGTPKYFLYNMLDYIVSRNQ
ncbi:MAG: hypothetical protein A2Y62_15675 [Candidatus Fischerbacteria bacterium RBG_13_37_8]|uniref:Polyprenyl synthetase n=1 Tax=Candidatus Fischerbacteria bacterium RBG_13_37_8 TaxID=1817863 RepID=A0A1F5VXD0_9BACT|nr:MAG: hypothetical protein A2Y62_15675 [Candidatus Fischerbacteria bacterium RBG_13_37_8]